jgi:anthranilate phosphoribosyltransferase
MADDELRQFLIRLTRREDLTYDEASRLVDTLLSENCSDAHIAAILIALSTKGETIEELAGMAAALRARAIRVECIHSSFVDTAGTGSSRSKTFNVSTAAAFVIAGGGLPVAKHGNRAASSLSGSADVLTALGVNISAAPMVTQKCLEELGICFMFAPLYHGATARVASVRRALGVHTSFNLLGPLSNPAGAPHQIIGVWKHDYAEVLANALVHLGTRRSWIVHGRDGLDEITLTGRTFVAEANEGAVRTFEIAPGDFGFEEQPTRHLSGGNPESNAEIIRDIVSGKRADEARQLVLINAAAALYVGGVAEDLQRARQLAEQSIESGAAQSKLDALIRATNE